MVAIAEELGLDLCEVMQARPFWIPEKWDNALEEMMFVAMESLNNY